jgi:hypothetical protein
MSRRSQPNILKLVIATIKRINKLIIKLNQIQLNMHLFKYLGEKLNKVKLLLKPFRKPPSHMSMSMGNDQNKVLNQLYLVKGMWKTLCKGAFVGKHHGLM